MLAAVGNYTTVIVVFTTVVTTNPKVTSVCKEHRSLKGQKLRAVGKKIGISRYLVCLLFTCQKTVAASPGNKWLYD